MGRRVRVRDFPTAAGYPVGKAGESVGRPFNSPIGWGSRRIGRTQGLMRSVISIDSSARLPLLLSSPIPQCEFDPIAYANLVVDFSKMIPDDVFADPEFLSDIFVFQSLGY
jgi:hypothetical protein